MVDVSGVLERMKGCVVIPTFNEAKIIHDLIVKIKVFGLDVLVVDDGSRDSTAEFAKKAGAEVIRHNRNMGKGASLRAGFNKVINQDYDFIITMDGDGQHRPEDIDNFIREFSQTNSDIIVGNRMDDPKNMPLHRWVTNKVMSMVISSICKSYIPDSQCGFRFIKKSVLKDMILSTSNYEIESELLIQAAKKNYRITSTDIKSIYEGQESQINPVVDTIRFFRFILKDQIKEGFHILKLFLDDTVIKHGSIIFLSSLVGNIFNLAFWLFMIRKLNYIDYGILNSMSSFLIVSGLPTVIIQTVLAKYFSEFKALEKKEEIQALFRAFLKRIIIINLAVVFVLVLFTPNIANFLNLESKTLIYLSALFMFFSNLSILTIGTMQGIHLFNGIAVNSIFQVLSKFFIGILLVFLGFRALGAFLGFVLSAALAFIFSLFQIPPWVFKMNRKDYVQYKTNLGLKDIYSYFLPVSIALIAYTIFTSTDVIFVKHFFSDYDTGIYSIVQTVGKILLFLPSALALVFFPVTIQHKTQNKNIVPLLKKSLFFVSALCIAASIFTFIFPRFVLRIISGHALAECVPLVRLIIFPMALFALNYIFMFYNLSFNNMRFIIYIFIISLLQIVAIILFHQTLFEIIAILFISSLLVFYLGLRSIHSFEKKKT